MAGVAARRIARECGATLRRTESLNASPAFIRLLAALVGDAIAGRPALGSVPAEPSAAQHRTWIQNSSM